MSEIFPPFHWTNLLIIPGLLIGYTVHELGHAFAAYFLGDYSQVERGKFTLNPLRHLSWFGTISFLLFGIGWPNPMEMDAKTFKKQPLTICAIAAAGPLASLTLSLAALMVTLLIAATLVFNSQANTDTIIQLLFPSSANLPETLDLQALTMAFTTKVAVASFWLTFTSILPLPSLDGFIIIFSLYAFFKTRNAKPVAPPQPTKPVVSLERQPAMPVNQYERRNNISDIHFKVGTEYHEAQKYDDAIARYRQAINNDKHFGPAYVNLGLAYLGKGKRREAIHAFRGAVQFADDQKSQQEAWFQLHNLSEVSPIDDNADDHIAEMGASPWVDTKPSPNWFNLGLGGAMLLVGGIALYGYLYAGLIRMLQG